MAIHRVYKRKSRNNDKLTVGHLMMTMIMAPTKEFDFKYKRATVDVSVSTHPALLGGRRQRGMGTHPVPKTCAA